MPSKPPALDVWDSCCLIGILNDEKDKLPALLAQTQKFEAGEATLGIPSAVVSEIVSLSDGTSAEEKVKAFLDNPYVILLQPTRDVSIRSGALQYRFDSKRLPELKMKAIADGVPKDKANRLGSRDSEVLATALEFKAQRLTTYDPFLCFLGKEYLKKETGLTIDFPDTSWLPMDYPGTGQKRVFKLDKLESE
jgi:hypothetical protein